MKTKHFFFFSLILFVSLNIKAQSFTSDYAPLLGDNEFNQTLPSGGYYGTATQAGHPNMMYLKHLFVITADRSAGQQFQISSPVTPDDKMYFRKLLGPTNMGKWYEVATRATNTFTGDQKVNGKIYANEIIIEQTTWADFVFEDNYELPSLNEVASHIKENKHLPGIPSAREVEENGISMGEMNAKLLQKIEELTLYIIQLESRMNSMEQKMY